jgi:hypothetical protein
MLSLLRGHVVIEVIVETVVIEEIDVIVEIVVIEEIEIKGVKSCETNVLQFCVNENSVWY